MTKNNDCDEYSRNEEMVKEILGFDISQKNCLYDKVTNKKVEVSLEQIVIVVTNIMSRRLNEGGGI